MDLGALGGAAQATPYGAALGALSGALAGSPSSSATGGQNLAGPVNVTVSGFGSKSSGSATASQTPSEQFSPSGAAGLPSWIIPAALIAVLAVVLMRR